MTAMLAPGEGGHYVTCRRELVALEARTEQGEQQLLFSPLDLRKSTDEIYNSLVGIRLTISGRRELTRRTRARSAQSCGLLKLSITSTARFPARLVRKE